MDLLFVEQLKKQWIAMIDAIDDPLVLLDKDLKIIRYNKAYWQQSGKGHELRLQELKDKRCFEFFVDRKKSCLHCPFSLARPAQILDAGHARWVTSELFDGKIMEVQIHVLNEKEVGYNYVVHYKDVTAQRNMQESLARADKLAALGKLAGGVAHEINSPLAGILAFSQMAIREMNTENPFYRDMVEIEEAAKKCKSIVEGMLGFARQENAFDPVPIPIFDVLRSTLRLAKPLLQSHKIELEWDLPADDWTCLVEGSSGKLGQVFLNIVTNAIHAMKAEGGKILIAGALEGQDVLITIKDEGCGIAEESLKKIFDPFFTTKPVGEGTGLGLSISYTIVRQHKGDITVQSAVGIGSAFCVRLPLKK